MSSSTDATDEMAREFTTRFTDEAFADAADLLSDDGRETVVESCPPDFERFPVEDAETVLQRYWYGLYGQYGAFEEMEDAVVDEDEATVELRFALGTQPLVLSFEDDAVADVSFPTDYTPPSYANQSTFTEREVTVDAGDVELGGTLTVPEGETWVPGVLLVHGAGLHDCDGTAGESKILKDFAWGLATQGVAVLRYEKRRLDHEDEISPAEFDLDTIVIDDAVDAVDELGSAEEVDADSVFVAGHSQGGLCAPSIAERYDGVAGIVSLDGAADPGIDEVDVDYMRYGISPDGELTEEQQELFAEQQAEFETVLDGDYDEGDTVLGDPATLYESFTSMDPVDTARDLSVPLFAATTERVDPDVQPELVEPARKKIEDWRAAESTDDDRFEHYEDVGHYFQEGAAPATTMEYLYFGGIVADYVVADVSEWVHEVSDA